MHDEPSRPSPAEEENRHDAAILGLLLSPDLNAPLAVNEITREIGDRAAVDDALARLNGAGLLHRWGDFVFSSAAARRFDSIGHGASSESRTAETRTGRRATQRYPDELDEPF